jgi:cytochrome b561
MFWHKREDHTYVAVALTFILLGAAIFAFGVIGWLINTAANQNVMSFPSMKVVGGIVIMSLGYIQMELGLLRKK